jgi:ABC-2 type transport system ATP-binding protein
VRSAIVVRGLRKDYGKVHAVCGIDLDIGRGEVFALLGPNGAGKSTTVEILEGHLTRTSGEVSVLGVDPAVGDRHWRSRIGIVLQTSNETLDLSVAELVRYFSQYYPRPRDCDEVIEAVGLTERAGIRMRALSGGERRRLDVALGIVGRPELLFLDEPTTGFDPEARQRFWGLVSTLSAEGTTILLTTHYLDEAEHLADRVGVIARGQLLEVNAPDLLGGRDTGTTTVSWLGPDGPRLERTRTPTALLDHLIAAADGEIPELTVSRPSLEDVYLQMIGAGP